MREIKFRCHQKGEIGYKSFKFFRLVDIVKQIGFEYGVPNNIPSDGGWVFDQFTGLRDKTLKEIYEGDIVEYRPPNKSAWSREEIKWQEGMTECCQSFYDGYDVTRIQYAVVIGNIHENPELLAG